MWLLLFVWSLNGVSVSFFSIKCSSQNLVSHLVTVWTRMRKSCWRSHHMLLPEPCLSTGKSSQLFFAQTPGQAFLRNTGLPLQRWPHGTTACEDQISHEILLQRSAQAKLALQRDFQPGMSAARPQLLPHGCVRGREDIRAGCGIWRNVKGGGWGFGSGVGEEEATREASPGHKKGEGRRDRRARPVQQWMQGGAGVYLYPNNYFHPDQPKVALVKR